MPSKKKKYNARFPPARIKKIMQSDEEVGKVAAAVPVIISRALELFVESLLGKTSEVTTARNAKTLTPSHLKRCIMSEARFDFLKDLVSVVPDCQGETDDVSLPDDEIARVQKQVLGHRSARTTRTRGRPRNSQSTTHINHEEAKDIKMEESEEEEEESDIMNLNSHSTCSEASPSVACSAMPSFPPSSSHTNNVNGIDNISNSLKTGNSGLSLSFYREISEVDSYSDNSPALVLNQAIDDDYDT